MRTATGRRLGVLAATTTAIALMGPGVASAAVSTAFDGTTIKLTGDDLPDSLTIGSVSDGQDDLLFYNGLNKDFDSATAGVQTIKLSEITADTKLEVNLGGGDDRVAFLDAVGLAGLVPGAQNDVDALQVRNSLNVWANNAVTIDGGAGNDTLFGTDKADTLRGGDGNDQLEAGKNAPNTNEVMEGGNGFDTLVWREGEGSDKMEGGGNGDVVLVEGSAIQGDQFTLANNNGRLKFDRSNANGLAPFTLDSADVERFQVNGLAGEDSFSAAADVTTPVTLDGGNGVDRFSGTAAADIIRGGDADDELSGGGGDDQIVGDRGQDTMNGGDGDDKLVWNNGDGTDNTIGDNGYDVTEVNGAATPEKYTVVAPVNGVTRLDRADPGAFGMNMQTEALELNTLGGDDDLTMDGAVITTRVDGGSGNDTLRGTGGEDYLFGGSGNDTLEGKAGLDALDGSVGDDALLVRDNGPDAARCGGGIDKVTTDQASVDLAIACETADVTPGGAPAAGKPAIGKLRLRARSGKATIKGANYRLGLKVACPAGGPACAGTMQLLTANKVDASGSRLITQLASKKYNVAAGRNSTLTMSFPRATRAFARKLKIAATAQTTANAVDGLTTRGSSKFSIGIPPKPKAR